MSLKVPESPFFASPALDAGQRTLYILINYFWPYPGGHVLIKKILLGCVLFGFLLTGVFVVWMYPHYTVPILMCHRFEDKTESGNLLAISAGKFEQRMSFLKRHGYCVIPVDELVEGIRSHRKFQHNTVAITIDDGYEDNWLAGYPVLKKYGFPATIFLVSDKIGVDKDFLTWDQVKEMAGHGISFGGHTRHHVYLPSIKDDAVLVDEVAGARTVIEKQGGVPVTTFCYPTGGYTPRAQAIAREAGYQAAFTTNRSLEKKNGSDMYSLIRVPLREKDSDLTFWAKVSGYYNFFRKGKEGY